MERLTANEDFMKASAERFVALLNRIGVKASVYEEGIEYDKEAFINYAKKTNRGLMPIWFTNYGDSNLRWLLGNDYQEIYKK